MTTARERLKTLSGLSGLHTAREHLAAITQDSGTGQGKTVFAAQMTVCLDTPQITQLSRPARALAVVTAPNHQSSLGYKRLDIMNRAARIDVTTSIPSLFIVQSPRRTQAVTTLPCLTVTRCPRAVVQS